MSANIEIRESDPADTAAIERLYPAAFPDEDLLPLLRNLLADRDDVTSRVATAEDTIAGHVVFTACSLGGYPDAFALLGPLAVAPALQKAGISSALVRDGLDLMAAAGVRGVFMLGDPGYYGRFGFKADARIAPPYPLPDAWRTAWQSIALDRDGDAPAGTLEVPEPWRQPALWGP